MQRLYSMFPGQAPGVALLLLRVSVAVGLFVDGSLRFPLDPGRWDFPLRLAVGVFLLAGARPGSYGTGESAVDGILPDAPPPPTTSKG